jgi:multicomponent Na+:H+ antiporter subunit F
VTPPRFALVVALPLLGAAILAAFVRLVRGPSLPDRVVAFDLLATIGIGVLCAHAIETNQAVFLDVTVVLALVSFLGTVGFAVYLRRIGA